MYGITGHITGRSHQSEDYIYRARARLPLMCLRRPTFL